MGVGAVGEWVVLMVTPTVAVAAALGSPALLRAIQRRRRRQQRPRGPAHAPAPAPVRPPIEQLAADLRRLLERHDALKQSTDVAVRGRKLLALEAAITDCAVDAAGALDVPCPPPAGRAALATPALRRLLHALADAGLVIEPLTGVFAAEDRR
jgi:hypothetical protein